MLDSLHTICLFFVAGISAYIIRLSYASYRYRTRSMEIVEIFYCSAPRLMAVRVVLPILISIYAFETYDFFSTSFFTGNQ